MKNHPWNDGGAKVRFLEGGRKPWDPRTDSWASFWIAKPQNKCETKQSTIHTKNEHPKTLKLIPKVCQKGTTIDA